MDNFRLYLELTDPKPVMLIRIILQTYILRFNILVGQVDIDRPLAFICFDLSPPITVNRIFQIRILHVITAAVTRCLEDMDPSQRDRLAQLHSEIVSGDHRILMLRVILSYIVVNSSAVISIDSRSVISAVHGPAFCRAEHLTCELRHSRIRLQRKSKLSHGGPFRVCVGFRLCSSTDITHRGDIIDLNIFYINSLRISGVLRVFYYVMPVSSVRRILQFRSVKCVLSFPGALASVQDINTVDRGRNT